MKEKNNTQFENAEQALQQKQQKLKRKKTRKRIIIFCLIFIVIAGAVFVLNFKMTNSRWPWQSATSTSATNSMIQTKVYESTYTTEIDVSGYIQAYQTQEVQMRANGSVTGVYVKEGDRVVKGQLLATIDSTSQEYNVAQIEWQIEKEKIGGTSSEKDLQLLEMNLKNAKQQLENTKAYANFDGVVVSVSISEGDYFEAGSTALTIIDDSKLKATVEIDEIDIALIEEGMTATLTSDSSSGQTIEAYVSYIPMIGRYSSQGIGVMDVEIVVDNPPESFKPGFSFEGTINVESEQTMLLVSQSAVTTKRGQSSVQKLLSDGKIETVTVVVKYLGENLYQIVSGDVQDGDIVVYSRSEDSDLSGLMGGLLSGGSGNMGGGPSGDMPSGGPSGGGSFGGPGGGF